MKSRADYVSNTDLSAQEACLSIIRDRHPGQAIMAEEDAQDRAGVMPLDGPVWVVDPLRWHHELPPQPSDVRILGGPGRGRQTGSGSGIVRAHRTSGGGPPEGTGPGRTASRFWFRRSPTAPTPWSGRASPSRVRHCSRSTPANSCACWRPRGGVRLGGAAALDLCYLAEGRFDAFWELFLNPWDFAAGWVIIEGSGRDHGQRRRRASHSGAWERVGRQLRLDARGDLGTPGIEERARISGPAPSPPTFPLRATVYRCTTSYLR